MTWFNLVLGRVGHRRSREATPEHGLLYSLCPGVGFFLPTPYSRVKCQVNKVSKVFNKFSLGGIYKQISNVTADNIRFFRFWRLRIVKSALKKYNITSLKHVQFYI